MNENNLYKVRLYTGEWIIQVFEFLIQISLRLSIFRPPKTSFKKLIVDNLIGLRRYFSWCLKSSTWLHNVFCHIVNRPLECYKVSRRSINLELLADNYSHNLLLTVIQILSLKQQVNVCNVFRSVYVYELAHRVKFPIF